MEESGKMNQSSVMKEMENNKKEVRAMVMDSYRDMVDDRGRDYKEFFKELENRYRLEKCSPPS